MPALFLRASPASLLQQRAATGGAAGRVCPSSSVPSSVVLRQGASGLRRCDVKAADTAAETLETFSLSDAKKANTYSSADVQQALAFYQDGEVRQCCWVWLQEHMWVAAQLCAGPSLTVVLVPLCSTHHQHHFLCAHTQYAWQCICVLVVSSPHHLHTHTLHALAHTHRGQRPPTTRTS